jgi:uncharacterized protein (DUF2267 family)
MEWKEFIRHVQKYGEIENEKKAEELIRAVFYVLSARLTIAEGEDLEAQLPKEIRAMWDDIKETGVNVIKFKKDEFIERVMTDGKLNDKEEAEKVINAVFKTLKEQVSAGEAKDVAAQLPAHLKEMWLDA